MSLPQHKKSAAEISRLRESLGIPIQAVEESAPPMVETASVAMARASLVVADPVQQSAQPDDSETFKLAPIPAGAETAPSQSLASEISAAEPQETAAREPKRVRSLKKSERLPAAVVRVAPPVDSNLPLHRHNDSELQRIRQQEVVARVGAPDLLLLPRAAHPIVVGAGYVLVALGAAGYAYYQWPIGVPAACVGGAWLMAAYILRRRPLSRHHAAFIAVGALFVTIFGALHYFPNLSHGA